MDSPGSDDSPRSRDSGSPTPSEIDCKVWVRDVGCTRFICSTRRSQVDMAVLGAALESEMIWWAKPLSPSQLATCIDNSLCFTLLCSASKAEDGTVREWKMIGLARLITDYVTFAYITDVFVLTEWQGRGLGKWMMRCVSETLDRWPDLRRYMLFTKGLENIRLYHEVMGMHVLDAEAPEVETSEEGSSVGTGEGSGEKTREEAKNGEGLVIMQKVGRASPYYLG